MTIDAIAHKQAFKLIAKYGKSFDYISIAEGSYDPATGSVSNTQTTIIAKGVVQEPTGDYIKQGLLKGSDKLVTVAAKPLIALVGSVSVTDKLTIDGLTFLIVSIEKIYSGEDVALFVFGAASK